MNLDKVTDMLIKTEVSYAVLGVGGRPGQMIEAGVAVCTGKKSATFSWLWEAPLASMKAIAMVRPGRQAGRHMGRTVSQHPCMSHGEGQDEAAVAIITDTASAGKMLLKGLGLCRIGGHRPQFTMTAPPGITAATGVDA